MLLIMKMEETEIHFLLFICILDLQNKNRLRVKIHEKGMAVPCLWARLVCPLGLSSVVKKKDRSARKGD